MGPLASAGLWSWAMPCFGLGEAAGEFADVAGADQLARGGVAGWRHCPVIAGGAAAPEPPPRVPAPEPVKLGILVVSARAGGHGVPLRGAGGRPRCRRRGMGRGREDRMCRARAFLAAGSAVSAARGAGGSARQATRLVIPLTTGAAGCRWIGRGGGVTAWPPFGGSVAMLWWLRAPVRGLIPWRFLRPRPARARAVLPHRARGRPPRGPGPAG
jgi:hypothetical protein